MSMIWHTLMGFMLFSPLLSALKSSYEQISALIKPLSKSVWMAPAASGAVAPAGIVQHLTSVSPAVKKYCRLSALYPTFTILGRTDLHPPLSARKAALAAGSCVYKGGRQYCVYCVYNRRRMSICVYMQYNCVYY
jgi:hypothetical protein